MMRNKSNIHNTALEKSNFTLIIQHSNETNLFDDIQQKLNIDGSILKINEIAPGTQKFI